MSHILQSRGGPYPSTTAGLGGLPTILPDVAICVVFLVLYACFAATNMTILQLNQRKGHKFLLSGMMFGFCMARITTLVLRIAWANRPVNIRLAIASQIFVNAGVLLAYIINLILAQRILRATQPKIGWNPIVRATYKALYFSIGGALIMVITSVVLSLYTLDMQTRQACRDVQLTAITYLFVFTCLPIFHLAAAFLLPKSKDAETFGEGSMRSKVIILTASTLLCMLIAGFKTGVSWSPPRPIQHPAWFDSKACFYVFNFMLEIFILAVLTFSRIDKRFFVPNGCNQAGDYTRLREQGQGSSESKIEPSLGASGDDANTTEKV
ncbi:hypothetical protein V495_08491 [Pseudogymnoascus sp. VKM F-4514 (FW-929)]|nr:hypothetical protein V495_08491 [Pseudogymnoascus sp. VKM F-4514 (FW-929)]KFY54751.1 hypothetical protein V497_07471 [Pseudogymnoascus sp. VKM F-4516 (FW-969)]